MAAPQSRLLVFFGPDQYVDVRTSLFSSLDVQSLVRLSATCKQLHSDILALWDVNLRLCRFFGDVDTSKAFRSQLGRCNALIAGSFALQFFEGVLWTESDLDIEVQRGIDLTVLHEWVVGPVGGYTLSPVDKEKGSLSSEWRESKYNEDAWDEGLVWLHNDVVEVRTYYKTLGSQKRKVQLIACRGIPVQRILRGYYTSCVVNFITWNKAFSIFPKTTFIDHTTVPLMNVVASHSYDKYAERGWGMVDRAADFEFDNSSCTWRRVGDARSWVLALDTTGVDSPSTPDSVIECNGFKVVIPADVPESRPTALSQLLSALGHEPLWGSQGNCSVSANLVGTSSLQYQYTKEPNELWKAILADLTEFEAAQLSRLQPEGVHTLVRKGPWKSWWKWLRGEDTSAVGKFVKPVGWRHIDEKLPEMIQNWWDQKDKRFKLLQDMGFAGEDKVMADCPN